MCVCTSIMCVKYILKNTVFVQCRKKKKSKLRSQDFFLSHEKRKTHQLPQKSIVLKRPISPQVFKINLLHRNEYRRDANVSRGWIVVVRLEGYTFLQTMAKKQTTSVILNGDAFRGTVLEQPVAPSRSPLLIKQ